MQRCWFLLTTWWVKHRDRKMTTALLQVWSRAGKHHHHREAWWRQIWGPTELATLAEVGISAFCMYAKIWAFLCSSLLPKSYSVSVPEVLHASGHYLTLRCQALTPVTHLAQERSALDHATSLSFPVTSQLLNNCWRNFCCSFLRDSLISHMCSCQSEEVSHTYFWHTRKNLF